MRNPDANILIFSFWKSFHQSQGENLYWEKINSYNSLKWIFRSTIVPMDIFSCNSIGHNKLMYFSVYSDKKGTDFLFFRYPINVKTHKIKLKHASISNNFKLWNNVCLLQNIQAVKIISYWSSGNQDKRNCRF